MPWPYWAPHDRADAPAATDPPGRARRAIRQRVLRRTTARGQRARGESRRVLDDVRALTDGSEETAIVDFIDRWAIVDDQPETFLRAARIAGDGVTLLILNEAPTATCAPARAFRPGSPSCGSQLL
jgi:hypothetical protein